LTGILVGLGFTVVGIFYAAAVPCFIGAFFLLLLRAAKLPQPSEGPKVAA
jgi:hypothetical protein